jgi:ATP-binding cassette subfamily F protein 3
MILVSHDREFLDGLCNKVYEFNQGLIREFPGGIFDFLQSRKLETLKQLEVKKEVPKAEKNAVQNHSKASSNAPKPNDKEQKQLITKIRNAEERISELETRLKDAELKLANPELYSNQNEAAKWLKIHETIKLELDFEMKSWEELSATQ